MLKKVLWYYGLGGLGVLITLTVIGYLLVDFCQNFYVVLASVYGSIRMDGQYLASYVPLWMAFVGACTFWVLKRLVEKAGALIGRQWRHAT